MGSPPLDTAGQAFRFIVVGGANTLGTAGIFLALSMAIPAAWAYTIAFVAGLLAAILVTPRLVFRMRPSPGQRLRYAGWYATIYLVGLGLVLVLHGILLMDNAVVATVTTIVTATLGFIGGRTLFRTDRGSRQGAGPRLGA